MAVNLETLLPQSFQEPFPLVPSNNGTEAGSLFDGDIFSPTSMYGNESLSFLEADSSSMSLDPSFFKDPALQLGDDGAQYMDPLYQQNPSGIFNDSWMTTPMSLPLTPDEPLGRDSPALSTASPIPTYNPTPIYPSHHAPSPAIPLTPDSLVSPQSSCNGEELDEVLSYFSGPVQCDGFPASEPSAATAGPSPSTMCNDSSSSLYSSYASLVSSPNSPLSPSSCASATPSDYTAAYSLSPPTPTPSSLTQHSITPQDTIRDLLAKNPTHSCYPHEDTAPEVNFEPVTPTLGGACSNKRIGASISEPVAKKAKASGAPRSRKRVSMSVKKERKREQNKTAALRYRQKKKEEKEEFESQQAELEGKNERLRETLKSLEAEVSYLKHFWAEVQHAKRMQEASAAASGAL